jgi:cytoskeleton protein RodZ
MTTVGETLRRERLRRKLDLDQISRELKISPRMLEAIEDEEFDKLPGGVFAKAFVRQYGRLLGLNEEELAAQMQQVLAPPATEIHETPGTERFALAPFQVPRMEEWQRVGDRRVRWSGSLSAAIVVVVVMLVCSAVYAWLQRPRNPVSAHNAPPQTAESVPTRPAPAEPAPAQPAPTQPVPDSAPTGEVTVPPKVKPATRPSEPGGASESAPAQPNPNAAVRLEVTAEETVWVLARSDGKLAFSGTMEAHQTRTVDAIKSVLLRLGSAGGVSITLNGKPIPSVGPKGQPRTVQFTSGGFQIVPAAKPLSEPGAPIVRR